MTSLRPNLFLIGSMKSGTTYLSDLLAEHPGIFMSSPKEPCYFVDDAVLHRVWPNMWKRGYWRSLERYFSLFVDAGEVPVIGEASTLYSYAPICGEVPARILAFSPDARFIYIMRDPVERSISHYWHRVAWWGERRSLIQAIRSDAQYTDVSHYALQLKEYLRYVSHERIYVLTYESLVADPVHQMSRIYAWLNVDSAFRPSKLGARPNRRPDTVYQVRGCGLLEKFRRTSFYNKIAPRVPDSARKLGYKLALRRLRPGDVPVEEVQSYLRRRQQCETEELRALLHRGFPEWKTLYRERECVQAPAFGSKRDAGSHVGT